MPGLRDYHEQVLGLAPAALRFLDADLAFARLDGSGHVYELAWGDALTDVQAQADGRTSFAIVGGRYHGRRASVAGALPLRASPLLRLSMIDVQQGDGLILDTPAGKLVTIDGGDNQLFARHLAARFAGTSAAKPLEVDAMIVTHGDADHFDGLAEIAASETLVNSASEPDRERKRVFVHPARVLHNGLVKRGGKTADGRNRKERDLLGATREHDGRLYLTGLVDSPLEVARADMNAPFRRWAATLEGWQARRAALGLAPTAFARVALDRTQALQDALREPGLAVDVLGPLAQQLDGTASLPFLDEPPDGPELHLLPDDARRGSPSASHTINGHSIALRLRYRNLRLLFTGDLNQQSMAALRAAVPPSRLRAELLKVPHHGSADFDHAFFRLVRPVVSIISSGDESAAKEYIHPRATLMSALGRASRGDTGIIFVTELAAFFSARGDSKETRPRTPARAGAYFGFERTNFGIVHLRSDGERVLVFTHSGKRGLNEAYGFTVGARGSVRMTPRLQIVRG